MKVKVKVNVVVLLDCFEDYLVRRSFFSVKAYEFVFYDVDYLR